MRELSLHILDLVQNSLEAGASAIDLTVIEDIAADKLIIRVSDNGRGMNKAECANAIDPFVTSRHTRTVGLGLPLIDMYTKRCGGEIRIDSFPGIGTTVEAVFQHSHLDRPPLGNMVETIKVIVIGNPCIDFKYKHITGKQMFSLSTLEIVSVLGNISLSSPAVITWLDEYLTDNLTRVIGGAEHENH